LDLIAQPSSDVEVTPPPVEIWAPLTVVEATQASIASEAVARASADDDLQIALNTKVPLGQVGVSVAPLVSGLVPPAYIPHLIIDGGHVLNVILPSQILSGGAFA